MSKQKTILDTVPEVPEAVTAAAEAYLKPKRQIAKARESMNAALENLIEAMHKADVTEILIDDGDKRLTLSTKDLVKIQKRKKSAEEGEAAKAGGEG